MTTAYDMVEIAERECKAHGVPIMAKRVNVFSMMLLYKKAVSAYELSELYEQSFHEPVPVVTAHRVLDCLQRQNLVHKLDTANKFIVCSHIDCNHAHSASQFLICKHCLAVKELSIGSAKFNELKQMVEQAGFHLDKPQFEMNCICEDCYANQD